MVWLGGCLTLVEEDVGCARLFFNSRAHFFCMIEKTPVTVTGICKDFEVLPKLSKQEENQMSSLRTKNAVKYVVPTMLSNVCFFLFTVVDGIFVGRGVGTNGLGAVNLVLPFTMIVAALFMLINIGGVTMVAVHLGRNDEDGANRIFRHGMLMLGCVAVILSASGVFFADPICTLLGADETFHQLSVDYLFWYSVFIIPSGFSMGLQNYCRNDGAPGLVSIAVMISTAFNIFGDWLLIFPFSMGTKGAAIATGISQTIALLIMLTHFIRKNGILRFGKTRLDGAIFRDIVIHGLPEGIGQLATPIMTLCMNLVLVSMIGDIGVNAFAVISYVASFTVAVFFGTSEGLQPLFGQSYGAKNERDLKFYFRTGILINFFGSMIVTGFILLLSRQICKLFGADPVTLEYTLKVMPLYSWGFIIMAFNVMISAYLYSTERTAQAVVINFLRSIAVSAGVILILPRVAGADIIWFTFGIYEAIVLVVAVILLKHSERNGIIFK